MSHFTDNHSQWLDSAVPVSEPSRVPIESQASVGLLLEAILDELRRINNTPREGAVSSVLIEDNPTKDRIVRVTSKIYAGSPLPVEEAIEAHGRAHRLAEQHALDGWRETIETLAAEPRHWGPQA